MAESQIRYRQADPETGIGLIQEYVKNNPSKIPPDADSLLQDLNRKLIAAKRARENVKIKNESFRNEVAEIAALIAASDLKAMEKRKLEELGKKIEHNLAIASKDAEISISPESREELNQASLKIADILAKIKAEEERIAQAEQVKREQVRLELEKRKKAEEEKLRQDRLTANNTLTGYQLLLCDFMTSYSKKKESAYLKKLVEEWLAENKKNIIPEALMGKCDFLLNTVIPCEPLILSIFEKNEAGLRGKTIPGNTSALKISDEYLIEKISDKSMKLMTTMGKVKIGRTIPLEQLTPEIISQLLQQRILSPDSGIKPSKQDINIILTFYLLNGMGELFSECLKNSDVFAPREKKTWETVADDIRLALDEKKSIQQALSIIEKAGADIKNKRYLQALHKIMTAEARYGNMKNLPSALKAQIDNGQKLCLDELAAASNIKNISDNRIPFYNWETETPGDAWSFEQIVKSTGKINADRLLITMGIGSSLDYGDWGKARENMNSGRGIPTDRFASLKGNLMSWAPSFIFAQGLVNLNYNDSESQLNSLSAIQAAAVNLKENPLAQTETIAVALSMEYALMLRVPAKASDIALNYRYSMQKPASELRIALLHLLATVNNNDAGQGDFSRLLKKYSEQFRQYQESGVDFQWCKAVGSILEDTKTADPKLLQFLKDSKCNAPDTCARTMASALAKLYAKGSVLNSGNEIIQILDSRVSGNLQSGELWKKLAVLKIARSGANTMPDTIDSLMNDCRICAIAFYPKLCIFKAGYDVMSGKTQHEAAAKNLSFLLESSTIASDSDKKCVEAILSGKPAEVVSKLISENRPATAFWCGILGIMTHKTEPALTTAVHKLFKDNLNLLAWEERFLLEVIVK